MEGKKNNATDDNKNKNKKVCIQGISGFNVIILQEV